MYFFEPGTFIKDVRRELKRSNVEMLTIASAYISIEGVKYIRAVLKDLHIPYVRIFCSTTFSESEHRRILTSLEELADVYIVHESFLHAKVVEIETVDKGYIRYCGSANMTAGGLRENVELMLKHREQNASLESFWEKLEESSVFVNERVIEAYEQYPKKTTNIQYDKRVEMLQKQLEVVAQEQLMNDYHQIDDFYFNGSDYSIFAERYWQDVSTAVQQQRKITQQKVLTLHERIEPFANAHHLYAHYHPQNITSTILPSQYNFYRVTGIWLRYGKHKDELNPFGQGRKSSKDSPIEQFHKHACLQLTIGEDSIGMGMFHSTANDGIDRAYVDENWQRVKEDILSVYDQLQGYDFIWTIYSNQQNTVIAQCELDDSTVEQFIKFYRTYDDVGYESFCMRYFDIDDSAIETEQAIVERVKETLTAIKPLYDAMTYRTIGQLNN